FTYNLSLGDAISGANNLGYTFTNTVAYSQTIYARVLLDGDCFTILPIEITVQNTQVLAPHTVYLCKNNTLELQATAISTSYEWNTGETTPSIEINTTGTYTVKYINDQGCELIETFQVILSDKPETVTVSTSDFAGSDNTLTVHAFGSGNYEYSLDGITYQDSNVF